MSNKETAEKLESILKKAGIATKSIMVTRASVSVEVYGQKAAYDVANLLNASEQWNAKVYSPEQTFSRTWKAGGLMVN